MKALTRSNPHLRLHEVDVSDFLGYGVLHLNPWVHLNKDVLARVWTHSLDQELNRSGVLVAKLLGEVDSVFV